MLGPRYRAAAIRAVPRAAWGAVRDDGAMLLKACLNGPRRPADHPALPVTPADLAQAALEVSQAGAEAVHVHAKDIEGNDTLDGAELAAVLLAVRAACPGLPVGATTGAWAQPDPVARVAAIRAWTVLPDFASVNWHEAGAEEVAQVLLDRGVAVEAGVWHADATAAWLDSPLRGRCLRVLLELPDGLDAAATVVEADRLTHLVGDAAEVAAGQVTVLLHGEGSSCWPALRHAGRSGLATRVGLEDVLTLPDGSPAADNAALVTAARRLLASPD